MKKILLILFLSLTFLSGCGGSGYSITYDTSPQGASVYCDGKKQGFSPVTLYYDFDTTKTYGKTKRCYAQWSSTGKENYSRTWNLKKFPNGVRQTLDIPKNSNLSSSTSTSKKRCKYGYYKVGNTCYKLPSNARAYNTSDGFYCAKGTYKKGNICFDPLSNSNNSANTKNNSSNSSSGGYKSSFGNTYQYDLSNPIDQLKYKTDPAAQLRDRTSNQYMRELEGILKESGGGIIRKDNSIKWKPVTSGQPSWGNINNNSPTWDWVN